MNKITPLEFEITKQTLRKIILEMDKRKMDRINKEIVMWCVDIISKVIKII
jgi:hypothetical protein